MQSPRSSAIVAFAVLIALASGVTGVSAASAASAPTSPGGIGVRLLPDMAAPSANPLTLSYIVEQIAPGSRVHRDVEISNTTNARADVVVYPAAANYVHNKFSFAPGRTKDSLARWTRVARSVIQLAPGATAVDAVTIAVPKSASRGERYAVIWAEVSAPSPTHSGVRLVNRVGIRMYVSVGKGGVPAAEFTIGALAASRMANGDVLIEAKVHDVGQGAIAVTGDLTLTRGPGGLSAGPFPIALETMLAPRHSMMEGVELGAQIPRGPWRADLSLSSDGSRRNSVTVITFPAPISSARTRSRAVPLLLATLSALLLVAVSGSVLFSRRRRLRSTTTTGGSG
jgi:hypothetical protein